MRRHRFIGLASGVLLVLALAGTALAKGSEISVALDPAPSDPHAGAPITLGVLITHPGGAPATGEAVTFELSQIGGGGLVGAVARENSPGHYTASVTVPAKGGWTVNVTATAEGMSQTFQPGVIQMLAPLPTASPVSPAAQTAPSWLLILGLVALAVAAGAAGRIVAIRRRAAVAQDRARA